MLFQAFMASRSCSPPGACPNDRPDLRGSSGGGPFDSRGRLLGITSFYLAESQGLNFAISPDTLSGVPKESLIHSLRELDE